MIPSPSTQPGRGDQRPAYMVKLGLLPPYSAQDVKQAYLSKVKQLHPDHAGNTEEFLSIQAAYQEALAYVRFHADRSGWIAQRMEDYVAVQEVIRRLKQFGTDVDVETVDWLKRSFGDFAELTESVVGIRLRDAHRGDELLNYIVGQHDRLLELRRLDLSGCSVSDDSVRQLSVFRRLANLDLSHTPITWEALHVIQWLPELESLNIEGTAIRWWTRRKLRAQMWRKRQLAAAARAMHPTHLR